MAEIFEDSLVISFIIGFAIPMTCLIATVTLAQYINYLQYQSRMRKLEREENDK